MQKTKTQRDMRNDHLSTVVNQTTILQKKNKFKNINEDAFSISK